MEETLLPLDIPAGMFKNGTTYQAKGRWFDGNLMRFWKKAILPIGGWRVPTASTGTAFSALTGTPRAATAWRQDDGTAVIGFATNSHLYVLAGGAVYDITPAGFTVGPVDAAVTSGVGLYGAGPYGAGVYGTGSLASTITDLSTWTLDVFGGYLVACSTSDHKLYVWQNATGTPAAVPSGAPTSCNAVVVTPERFLFALGAYDSSTSAANARLVQWASQETITDWTPSSSNTAGDFPLSTAGKLMCGQRTVGETLLWTDVDLHVARYIGGTLVYSFRQVGDGCGILAPNAKAVLGSNAFWMGNRAFYAYNGAVQQIPCDVADYVFSDFNWQQKSKVFAFANAQYSEIWWFYPSSGSTANDRYVVYNYDEAHWTVGKLARECGVGAGATQYPILCDASGVMWEHEVGTTRSSALAYLETGPIELATGDNVMKINRIVPDERTDGDVGFILYSALFPTPAFSQPNSAEQFNGPYSAARPTACRVTARQVRLFILEAVPGGSDFRLGTIRLGVRKGGRR